MSTIPTTRSSVFSGVAPAEPITEITPALRGWSDLLGSIWARREIVFYLALRDIRVRYHQTALGSLWAIMQPLAATLVFAVVFGRLVKISTGETPYPIFLLTGMLPWQFMAGAIQRSSASLVANGAMIKKVYFPRLAVPTATVATALIDFCIGCVVLVGLMAYYDVTLTVRIAMVPAMLLLCGGLSLGIGLLLASINCRFRDVTQGIGFAMQMWMFLTPIVYPFSMVPERFQAYVRLNPMTGVICGFRTALLDAPLDTTALLVSVSYAALFLVVGGAAFRRAERGVADLL
jgi:lipopolysaccharide transport system permease protein